jgi:hypothetical protein
MQSVRKLSIASIVIATIVISGCATQSQHDTMVSQGYPLAYADGFDDGCQSGKNAGGSIFDQFKKDVKRFGEDTQYTQGWSDGFRQCETAEEASQRQIRMSIEQQRLIEERKLNDTENQRHLEREALDGIDTSGLENLK